jgi:hypothetical protein
MPGGGGPTGVLRHAGRRGVDLAARISGMRKLTAPLPPPPTPPRCASTRRCCPTCARPPARRSRAWTASRWRSSSCSASRAARVPRAVLVLQRAPAHGACSGGVLKLARRRSPRWAGAPAGQQRGRPALVRPRPPRLQLYGAGAAPYMQYRQQRGRPALARPRSPRLQLYGAGAAPYRQYRQQHPWFLCTAHAARRSQRCAAPGLQGAVLAAVPAPAMQLMQCSSHGTVQRPDSRVQYSQQYPRRGAGPGTR